MDRITVDVRWLVVATICAGALLLWKRRLDQRRNAVPGVPDTRTPSQPRVLDSHKILLYRTLSTQVGRNRYLGVITGDIRRVKFAEVWVNPENTSMQMARFDEFSVSSIIRYEGARRDGAGQVVQDYVADELARKLAGRRSVPAGTAIATGAGQLAAKGVRHVVHVAAVQGEPGSGFRQTKEVGRCVTNALAMVDQLDTSLPLRSVLLPLLGTGTGGGPTLPTVNSLVGATIDYFTTVPETGIEVVYLLAYTDIELEACEASCLAHGLVPVDTARVGPFVEPTPVDQKAVPEPVGARTLHTGFVLDVVAFGSRLAPAQEAVQRRLAALLRAALDDVGVELDTTVHQWTGDGAAVVLPSDADPTRTTGQLLESMWHRLVADNEADADRLRLRMALGVGLVAIAPTGFAGSMVLELSRLVDSGALRSAVRTNPGSDLVVLISEHLHSYIIRPGYLRLPGPEPIRVEVAEKEFRQPAWLWVPPAATGEADPPPRSDG